LPFSLPPPDNIPLTHPPPSYIHTPNPGVPVQDPEEWRVGGPGSVKKKSPSEIQIDSANRHTTFATFYSPSSLDAIQSGNYSVLCQVKIFPTTQVKSGTTDLVFSVLLRSGQESATITQKDPYTCVTVNMYQKMIQIEHNFPRGSAESAIVDQILLPKIKMSSFFDMKITVSNHCIVNVFIDNACILADVNINNRDIHFSRFGIALSGKGVATVKNLSFAASQQSDSKPSLPPYLPHPSKLFSYSNHSF
jgi:hypothetical protein